MLFPRQPNSMIVVNAGSRVVNGVLFDRSDGVKELTQMFPGFLMAAGRAIGEDPEYGFVPVTKPSQDKFGTGVLQRSFGEREEPNLWILGIGISKLTEFATSQKSINFQVEAPYVADEVLDELFAGVPSNVFLVRPRSRAIYVGVKEVFQLVEGHLRWGRYDLAREYLARIGFEDPGLQLQGVEGIIEYGRSLRQSRSRER